MVTGLLHCLGYTNSLQWNPLMHKSDGVERWGLLSKVCKMEWIGVSGQYDAT